MTWCWQSRRGGLSIRRSRRCRQHDLDLPRLGPGGTVSACGAAALAFNFAGPPGTGKTLTAEAVAKRAGAGRLLTVKATAAWRANGLAKQAKHIAARLSLRRRRGREAVLFFDEADAIASRCDREHGRTSGQSAITTQSVNILLEELKQDQGVVIFATNMAANFDPAFERGSRARSCSRCQAWPNASASGWRRCPPADTAARGRRTFAVWREQYEVGGGDIRNAVLKAATIAAHEASGGGKPVIRSRHLEAGILDVVAGKRVMQQSLVDAGSHPAAASRQAKHAWLLAATAWPLLLSATALAVAVVALIAALVG